MRKSPKSKTRKTTPEERKLLEEGWEEIGKSLAMTVVHGGKSQMWAWQTLKPIGIYEHWMLIEWIKKCKKEYPNTKSVDEKKNGRPRVATQKSKQSIFKSSKEVKDALKMLNEGVDPSDIIEMYSRN